MQASPPNRMTEAQELFRRVVRSELDLLLEQNIPREVAVKILLQRIVKNAIEPTEAQVRKVMVQFHMNRDDAVRALIVKQELARLKLLGLDSFAAIEEITLKMQRVLPLSPRMTHEDNDTEDEKSPSSLGPTDLDGEHTSPASLVFRAVDACPSPDSAKRNRKNSCTVLFTHSPRAASEPEATKSNTDDDTISPSSGEVSLCQQINNVSISASPRKDAEAIVDTPLVKLSRKRRIPVDNDTDVHRSGGTKNRFGKSKKARLDVDCKIKAQVEEKIKAQAGDSFVLVKAPTLKRSRPKSNDGATDTTFTATKKQRSE
ncbi:hypothetical protein THRCLA_05026 [Thraustotheca clavata]|uniref:Uncharacterized protein n=1 Tax=Thraustotheca clavata TaxID=74557 RepID=A0A1V9ZXU6_9STRA|nr:hypothetical protein THRCLA_05026 [Thraustotheca clavata]